MAMALISRGWRYGHNLLHLCFPHAEHDEKAWGLRLHLPLQFINGAVARASRGRAGVRKQNLQISSSKVRQDSQSQKQEDPTRRAD
jgi:hypothetical protein